MEIDLKIYRGKIEPVRNIEKAKLILHENHLELLLFYEFDSVRPIYDDEETIVVRSVKSSEVVMLHCIIPKHGMNIIRSTAKHDADPEKEVLHFIDMSSYGDVTSFGVEFENCNKVFKELRAWLLK